MITVSGPIQIVMLCVLVVLIVLIVCSLVYAIVSHRFTDKIVAANMIGSLTMNIMVILAVYLGQSYILDSGMIIALLSFLSVIVLCRVVTDHIFGQLRHLRDKENGEITREHMAKVGTEHHRVRRTGGDAAAADEANKRVLATKQMHRRPRKSQRNDAQASTAEPANVDHPDIADFANPANITKVATPTTPADAATTITPTTSEPQPKQEETT